MIDERRVKLDQAGPRRDPRPGVVGRGDAARGDERQLAPARGAELAQRVERERLQRRARQAASFVAVARFERRAATRWYWRRSARRSARRSRRGRCASWSPASRSGATFRNTGGPPGARAAAIAPSSSTSSPPAWRLRRPGRVGRADVDREIVGDRRHRRDPRDIIGDAVRAVLVGADVDPDDAAARALAEGGASAASWPWLLNPMRLMTASSSTSRNSRGRGLPCCGRGVSVPTSTKPNPSPSIASGTSPSLSNPAASPTGEGKASPATSLASDGAKRGRRAAREQAAARGSSRDARFRRRARRPEDEAVDTCGPMYPCEGRGPVRRSRMAPARPSQETRRVSFVEALFPRRRRPATRRTALRKEILCVD